MKVFVTGGTGFIGQNTLKRLIELGHECICLVRGSSIRALLNTKSYHKGKKVSDQQMHQINLERYTQRPNWNYSISP